MAMSLMVKLLMNMSFMVKLLMSSELLRDDDKMI